jgi:hypothetical protein
MAMERFQNTDQPDWDRWRYHCGLPFERYARPQSCESPATAH